MITVFAQGDLVFENDALSIPTDAVVEALSEYLPANIVEAVKSGVEIVISLSVGESAARKLAAASK